MVANLLLCGMEVDRVTSAVKQLRSVDCGALPPEACGAHVEHFWGHETAPGRLVAIQRMAQVAGLAWLDDATHLCLHPEHGPWVSFRAVVLVDVPGPPGPPPAMRCPAAEGDLARAAAAMSEALGKMGSYATTSREAADAFLEARLSYSLGSASVYPPDMIEYHYHNDLGFLETAPSAK
ncbi:hypothetical protein JKP88DRAFT_348285 [Tribonema minus]|uniref:Uncharacterized protein n=1 Tax=Tribonema minus TaxID=303371 RepID=A0A835Z5B1_9STRA|nr:hypothetical protein JKP88DRAFT_348285 [Tribonema minus]